MSTYFAALVGCDPDGQVHWSLCTGTAAEVNGLASVSRRGLVGGPSPDDGSGVREANVLIALESLGSAIMVLSRTIAWSYSLLPPRELLGDNGEIVPA
jgi:hypothetical protein